jgi:hypothetical protein
MTIVEFPKTKTRAAVRQAARRLAASKPRCSKNGTPDERAAKKASAAIVEITPRRADRIVASVVKLLGKNEGAAQPGAPRDTLAARREAMSALLKLAEQTEQSDPGPSAA